MSDWTFDEDFDLGLDQDLDLDLAGDQNQVRLDEEDDLESEPLWQDGNKMLDPNFVKSYYSEIELHGTINKEVADQFVAKLKCLNSKFICISIHSNGGSIYEGLRIIEEIGLAKRRGSIIATLVNTIAFSVAVPIFCCGDNGYRFLAENAQIMIHQPFSKSTSVAPLNQAPAQVQSQGIVRSEYDCASPGLYKTILAKERKSEPVNLTTTGNAGAAATASVDNQHLKKIRKQLDVIIISCLNIDKRGQVHFIQCLNENADRDWFLTSEEALEYGLANYIGVPQFVPLVKFQPSLELQGKLIRI